MTTTERIKKLIYNSGKSDYAIKKETGLGNSVLSDLKAGRAENPSVKTIKILANYFNVSADYLLCLTDTPTPLNLKQEKRSLPAERPDSDITDIDNIKELSNKFVEDYKELIGDVSFEETAKLYQEITPDQRKLVVGVIAAFFIGTLHKDTYPIIGR